MTYRTLLILKALVCLAFGIPLLFAPAWLLGIMGGTLGAAGVFTARIYGASLFGTLMLTWFGKEVAAPDGRRAILLHMLVYDAIGAVVAVTVTVGGVLNALGWGIVAVYVFFTAGPAWILARVRPTPSAA